MISVVLSIIVLVLAYLYVQWRYTYWKRLGVPCPQPVFFFGNIFETLIMKSHIISLSEKWYK